MRKIRPFTITLEKLALFQAEHEGAINEYLNQDKPDWNKPLWKYWDSQTIEVQIKNEICKSVYLDCEVTRILHLIAFAHFLRKDYVNFLAPCFLWQAIGWTWIATRSFCLHYDNGQAFYEREFQVSFKKPGVFLVTECNKKLLGKSYK